jgi:hypothetical protein
MELFNTDLLSLTEISLEKLEGKILEAEEDRYCMYNITMS